MLRFHSFQNFQQKMFNQSINNFVSNQSLFYIQDSMVYLDSVLAIKKHSTNLSFSFCFKLKECKNSLEIRRVNDPYTIKKEHLERMNSR